MDASSAAASLYVWLGRFRGVRGRFSDSDAATDDEVADEEAADALDASESVEDAAECAGRGGAAAGAASGSSGASASMSSRNSDRDGGIAGAREEARGERQEPPLFLAVLSTLAARLGSHGDGESASASEDRVCVCSAEQGERARKRRGLVERFWTGLGGVRGRFSLRCAVSVQPLFVFFLSPGPSQSLSLLRL